MSDCVDGLDVGGFVMLDCDGDDDEINDSDKVGSDVFYELWTIMWMMMLSNSDADNDIHYCEIRDSVVEDKMMSVWNLWVLMMINYGVYVG